MEIIEDIDGWRRRYADWKQSGRSTGDGDVGEDYPFVRNRRAPFTAARRALPMLNLALISSAGAYIDGTPAFVDESDITFKEIPVDVESEDLRYSARGYDPAAVQQDMNAEIPIERLREFENNGIIGQLNPVFGALVVSFPTRHGLLTNSCRRCSKESIVMKCRRRCWCLRQGCVINRLVSWRERSSSRAFRQ